MDLYEQVSRKCRCIYKRADLDEETQPDRDWKRALG